jgi:hemerythrin-like domain-containing protein
MKTATRNLEDDHVHILKLLDVMEYITCHGVSDVKHIETIVDIIRNFADGLHHAKEEDLFFPFLSTKGFSPRQGPVAVMLSEHVQGRSFVKGISDNINLFKGGDESALAEIHLNMNGYAELLRNHIAKENNILFRMADNVISESEHILLLNKFGETELSHSSSDSNDYIKMIEALGKYYNIKD